MSNTEQNKNSRILHLTLKKKWFDMILSGEKKEEYREIKPYWNKRFLCDIGKTSQFFYYDGTWNGHHIPYSYFKRFDVIKFTNGYGNNAPSFMIQLHGINIEVAVAEWSDNAKGFFYVLKLGEILSK